MSPTFPTTNIFVAAHLRVGLDEPEVYHVDTSSPNARRRSADRRRRGARVSRDAQRQGQWTATRAYADPDAVMFTPQAIWAREFLEGRKDPAVASRWSPNASYVSCDGKMAVNTGPWRKPVACKAAFSQLCGNGKRASGTGSPTADTRLKSHSPRARRRSCARVHVKAARPVRRSWPHLRQSGGQAARHPTILAGAVCGSHPRMGSEGRAEGRAALPHLPMDGPPLHRRA